MGLLSTLYKQDSGESETLYECRDCGATVSPETERCPTCDATGIARYRF